jgi:hypothetical protein
MSVSQYKATNALFRSRKRPRSLQTRQVFPLESVEQAELLLTDFT